MATESDKPVVLYTAPTPNGWVPAVLLEEFKVRDTLGKDLHRVLNGLHH